jgi:hypothetical protein
MCFLSV